MKQVFILMLLLAIITACKKTTVKPDITGIWSGKFSDADGSICWQLKSPDSILVFFNELPLGDPDERGTWVLNGNTFKAILQEISNNNIYKDSAVLSNDFRTIVNGVRFFDGIEIFKFTLIKQ